MDGYACFDACSNVTGVCMMDRKRVNIDWQWWRKRSKFKRTSLHTRDIYKITNYYKYSYTPSFAQCIR